MYDNFRVAIYAFVGDVLRLADKGAFEREFARVAGQLRFDKVYLEVYRSGVFASDEQIDFVKTCFQDKGVETAGGVTPARYDAGPLFYSFDYADPDQRAECRRSIERAARHFDEVILDDFFFFNSKSDAAIEAKGQRNWTRYRLDTMREVSRELVLEPARAVNPNVKVTIKYPNWYEHFHGLGYDLEEQPHLFDSIYTGTETRDPYVTDQVLQQYQSYLTYRYFSNIRPDGGNRGGWVDTYHNCYIDRYAEQLWDTLFAGAPEITLFNWTAMADEKGVEPGERGAWADAPTSFDWDEMVASSDSAEPGWARAAGYALEQVDRFVGRLGRPVGIAAYRPYHASGEDYLHNYLGNIGFPIELTSTFPDDAGTLLLTECAACDDGIVERIRERLTAGADVIVTSGLVAALQDKGLRDIVEIECTGRTVDVNQYIDGYGSGAGTVLNTPGADDGSVRLPEIRYLTNDCWPIIRAIAGAKGVPVVLMNEYSRGTLYVLTIPDNPADLYKYPRALITQIKRYIIGDVPVRLEAEPLISLFVYDNNTFIVQSFRDAPCRIRISVRGTGARPRSLLDGQMLETAERLICAGHGSDDERTEFECIIQPHSYQVYEILS